MEVAMRVSSAAVSEPRGSPASSVSVIAITAAYVSETRRRQTCPHPYFPHAIAVRCASARAVETPETLAGSRAQTYAVVAGSLVMIVEMRCCSPEVVVVVVVAVLASRTHSGPIGVRAVGARVAFCLRLPDLGEAISHRCIYRIAGSNNSRARRRHCRRGRQCPHSNSNHRRHQTSRAARRSSVG
jgi:hypothetical protein